MLTERIPRYRLAAYDVPFKSAHNGLEVSFQKRANSQSIRYPPNYHGEVLKYVRINCYSKGATLVVDGTNSPRDKGLSATTPADLEIVANAVDPSPELTFVNPATEIVHFIPRIRPWPNLDGITFAEWMTRFEVAGHRYRLPYGFGGSRDFLLDRGRPFER